MDGALESHGRSEPRGFTMADLVMLVAGFAVVLALPQLHHPAELDFVIIGATPNPTFPDWFKRLLVLREVTWKCGLIPIPAIMARRVRYGGMPHPAEWLAIFVALSWVHDAFERFGVTGYGYGDRRWGKCNTLVCLAILATWCSGSRRFPGWVNTALLLAVATTGLEAAHGYLFREVHDRTMQAAMARVRPSPANDNLITNAVFSVCNGILLVAPFLAAVLALRLGPRARWTWLAWVGAMIGVVALVTDIGFKESPSAFNPKSDLLMGTTFLCLPWVVAALVSGMILRWKSVRGFVTSV